MPQLIKAFLKLMKPVDSDVDPVYPKDTISRIQANLKQYLSRPGHVIQSVRRLPEFI